MHMVDAMVYHPETFSGPKHTHSQLLEVFAADGCCLSGISFGALTPPPQLLSGWGFALSQEAATSSNWLMQDKGYTLLDNYEDIIQL